MKMTRRCYGGLLYNVKTGSGVYAKAQTYPCLGSLRYEEAAG